MRGKPEGALQWRRRVRPGAPPFKPQRTSRPVPSGSSSSCVKRRLAACYFPALLNAVSSPQGPLTAVFGMGTGVAAPPWPPAGMDDKSIAEKSSLRAVKNQAVLRALFPPRPGRQPGPGGEGGQTSRPIRSAKLQPSRVLHTRPVNPVFCRGSSGSCDRDGLLRGGLALRCLQRLSRRDIATRQCP